MIIPARQAHSYLERPEFVDARIVTLDRPAPVDRFDSVLVENRRGAALAVEHLIQHGHRRIVCIGLSKDLYTMSERFAGYRQALDASGLQPEPYLDCSSMDSVVPAIATLLQGAHSPTAFFCANNLTMRYALLALSELAISIPDRGSNCGL